MKTTPGFLHGRIRRSYILISQPSTVEREQNAAAKKLNYKLVFHQYLGVPGLGITVTPFSSKAKGIYRPSHAEEILFLDAGTLSVLSGSTAGSKERKLPDLLLKNLRFQKREFIKDWMKGYINLSHEDDEFLFSVEEECDEKNMWVEYVGMFDAMGTMISEPKLATTGNRRVRGAAAGTCASEEASTVEEAGVSGNLDVFG